MQSFKLVPRSKQNGVCFVATFQMENGKTFEHVMRIYFTHPTPEMLREYIHEFKNKCEQIAKLCSDPTFDCNTSYEGLDENLIYIKAKKIKKEHGNIAIDSILYTYVDYKDDVYDIVFNNN